MKSRDLLKGTSSIKQKQKDCRIIIVITIVLLKVSKEIIKPFKQKFLPLNKQFLNFKLKTLY